jgi:hypothetical protein
MFTNQDALEVLNHNEKLIEWLYKLADKPGGPMIEIHEYALGQLLREIACNRRLNF